VSTLGVVHARLLVLWLLWLLVLWLLWLLVLWLLVLWLLLKQRRQLCHLGLEIPEARVRIGRWRVRVWCDAHWRGKEVERCLQLVNLELCGVHVGERCLDDCVDWRDHRHRGGVGASLHLSCDHLRRPLGTLQGNVRKPSRLVHQSNHLWERWQEQARGTTSCVRRCTEPSGGRGAQRVGLRSFRSVLSSVGSVARARGIGFGARGGTLGSVRKVVPTPMCVLAHRWLSTQGREVRRGWRLC